MSDLGRRIQSLFREAERQSNKHDRDIYIDAIAELKREELRRHWLSGNIDQDQKAGQKRAINKIARDLTKRLRRRERIPFDRQLVLLRKFRPSAVLDALYPARGASWRAPIDRHREETPSPISVELMNFSFFEDPNSALASVAAIAEVEAKAIDASIHFRDPYCLDIAPYMLLSEFWHQMLPVFRGGQMDIPVQKVVASVGLARALGMQLVGLQELSDVWAFPMFRRRPQGSSRSDTRDLDRQRRELAGDVFCAALDQWLEKGATRWELSDDGRGWIKNIFGELLDNAERHSDGERKDGAWSVAGFMARRWDEEAQQDIFRCYLGFVNMGDTFSESLERSLPEVRRNIDAYVDRCRDQGCGISDETLRTLCAIQDGVTCDPEADKNDRGGFGLQEMLDLVSALGVTDKPDRAPRVTILSGNACIMLRAPYIRGRRGDQEGAPRLLWCNEQNTSKVPPDDDYVFDLRYRVPGTVISIAFTIDPEYLERIK